MNCIAKTLGVRLPFGPHLFSFVACNNHQGSYLLSGFYVSTILLICLKTGYTKLSYFKFISHQRNQGIVATHNSTPSILYLQGRVLFSEVQDHSTSSHFKLVSLSIGCSTLSIVYLQHMYRGLFSEVGPLNVIDIPLQTRVLVVVHYPYSICSAGHGQLQGTVLRSKFTQHHPTSNRGSFSLANNSRQWLVLYLKLGECFQKQNWLMYIILLQTLIEFLSH